MLEIIKTNDGYMVQHMDGELEGEYVCDANGDNLWDWYHEAEAVLQAASKLIRYKVWAKSTTYLYAFVEAANIEEAWEQAFAMDGSEYIAHVDGDWDIESIEEAQP